jgi:hypothetical protein
MTTDTAAPSGAARVLPHPVQARRVSALRRHRVTLAILTAAVFIGVIGPLLLSWWTGSLHIPHNDTWAFSRSAEIFARTGHIRLFNWNAMALIGAFVPLGPLGRTIASQTCAIAVLSVISLLVAFDVLRRVTGARRAALGVLVLVIWPGYGLLSTSLMTDIPAFASAVLVLAIGRRAIERESVALLALCGLIGLWGFTVREQTIAATVAVFGAALSRPRLRSRSALISLGAIVLVLGAAAGAVELWRRSLPNGSSPTFNQISVAPMAAVIGTSLGGLLLIGLMVSPVVFLVARPSTWSPRSRAWAQRTFVISAVGMLWYGVHFTQNYLSTQGSYAAAFLGTRPDVLPQTVWDLLLPLACVSSALLAGLVVERIRKLPPELALFLMLTAAGSVLETYEGEILFDRYIFPAVLPLLALLLREPLRPSTLGRPRLAIGAGVGALLTLITGALTANALSFDAATWHTAQQLVDSGAASAAYIDAGLDWDGYYSPDGVADEPDPDTMYGIYAKAGQLGHGQPCYVIASRPQDQDLYTFTLVATPGYDKFGVYGPRNQLFVYRTYRGTCH